MQITDFWKSKKTNQGTTEVSSRHKHPKIVIGDREEAESYAAMGFPWTTLAIVIHDSGVEPVNFFGVRNVESQVTLGFDNTLDDTGMSEPDAQKVARAVHDFPDVERIFICSECGHCRSASVAAAIEKYFYDENAEFVTGEQYTINHRCFAYTYNALIGRRSVN